MTFANRIADADKLQQEIKQHRPLKGQALKQLQEYFRIGLTWSSNALEGNSLTETETKVVIEDGITIGGKPLKDHFEAIGHAEAFDYLQKLARHKEITERDILRLHKLFYYRIGEANAGHYRKQNIIVTGTDVVFPAPSELKELMDAFAEEIPRLRGEKHPIEFAALLHTRLVTIHPFVDGNGRAARLLMNLALLQEGYPVTIIPPVLRSEYLTTVRESNTGNVAPFVNLLSSMVWESQRDYLRMLESLERK
ncbi:Fic family protein [Geobacter sp.]|uniref:Fic family protein n=1 Tax=Geobacter sp. TaxID=46610 RepID=UPI002636AA2C|nr:Fic family protein [Geobacter sp.]